MNKSEPTRSDVITGDWLDCNYKKHNKSLLIAKTSFSINQKKVQKLTFFYKRSDKELHQALLSKGKRREEENQITGHPSSCILLIITGTFLFYIISICIDICNFS